MDRSDVEGFLNNLNGSDRSYPFGPEALVYKVMHKMFALVAYIEVQEQADQLRVSLKCDPVDAEVLVSEFDEIEPGYHLNKRHWITITVNDDLPEGLVLELAKKSYDLVVSNLIKKDREALESL